MNPNDMEILTWNTTQTKPWWNGEKCRGFQTARGFTQLEIKEKKSQTSQDQVEDEPTQSLIKVNGR